MRFAHPVLAIALSGTLAACANTGANFVPVVDGPVSASFQSDLAACQQLAAQQGAFARETGENVLTAAGVAAAGTALVDNRGNNVRDAAAVGALAGVASGALSQQRNKENIIRNCMRQRGHNVVN